MTRKSTDEHVVRMAQRHPRMRIWFAHASGRWEEAGRAIRHQPNVCLDICGGEPEDGIVDTLVRDLGADRIFFGSDAPGRCPIVQMTKVLLSMLRS